MTCQIRPATEKDLPFVYKFICLLEDRHFDCTSFESVYKANISNRDYHYLVAVLADDEIAGFISCHAQQLLHHCGKVAEIQELYVDERHRQQGIGKLLINYIEKQLRNDQCRSFEVTSQNKRLQTHTFYQALGFEQTHKKFVKQLV